MKPHLEHIPHELKGSIYAYIYQNESFTTPWHYHEDLELTYILKSSGIRHVGNHIDNFTKGDLVLIGKNVPHCWKNDTDYKNGAISSCIQWNESVFKNLLDSNLDLQNIQQLIHQSEVGIKFTNPSFNLRMGERIKKMAELEAGKKFIELLDILNELANCKSKFLLSVKENASQYSKKTDTRIKAILDHIDASYSEKICIKDMTDITFMTEGAFCKYFKKQFKKSFTNYLNEFRVRKACILLQETDDKLFEIGAKCGYENLSFFHRQFKKYTQMTPREYRNKTL
ncbi:AraC family transcriptional regulator [Wenyingzhuangia sp. IMCC45574]